MDDYALIQSHPREGAALLNPYRFLYEAARLIAHHHERWDGAGYPYGLRGAYIPLAARILAIADVFDSIAVRSTSLHSALRTLQASAGSQFDPALTTTFCTQLHGQDRFPALSVNAVSLTTLTAEPTVDQLSPPHTSLSTF
ncbi:MAG: HD domain-containing protein [Nitrospira sp.]|nr:HD domain-containing protein [Nitrospira sp.]